MSYQRILWSIIACFLLISPLWAGAQDYPTRNTGVSSVALTWSVPTSRKDGSTLGVTEIGGFEVVYRRIGAPQWTTHLVEDGSVTRMGFNDLPDGTYEFALAVFDSDGVYSGFVPGDRTVTVRRISPPADPTLQVEQTFLSQVEAWYDCIALDVCEAEVTFTMRSE